MAAGSDLTQRQYAVLAAVAADEGLTQAELVRSTGIDRSTLAELVGRMRSKGLLERERSSKDGRANAVRLTEEGKSVLASAEPGAKAADKALLKLIPSSKRDGFLAALRALATEPHGPRDTAEPKAKKPKKDKKAKRKAKKAKAEAEPAAEPTPALG